MGRIFSTFGHLLKPRRRSRAQSMLEFALALPILLLLIFGIIEFGRLLQAWLALENGARFGVRFAVTGSFDPNYCEEAALALNQDPAFSGIAAQDRDGSGKYDCRLPEPAYTASQAEKTRVQEWNNALQDWARLPSIRDAALSGATGIAWTPDVSGDYTSFLSAAIASGSTFSQTGRGVPGERGYFNITTCSNRVLTSGARFGMNYNLRTYSPAPTGQENNYNFPALCERRSTDLSSVERFTDDAGGPGDRVRVVLTYRHTLITPFLSNWWPTLRLTTEREGIVEKFRTSRVTGLSGAIVVFPSNTPTYTPETPTSTATPTDTATATATPYSCANNGSVLRQVWTGISGSALSYLYADYRYPDNASSYNYTTSFEAPSGIGDNYGQRMRAYLCPPYTGEYSFWIASDDQGVLLLSGNQNPAGASQIAAVSSWTNSREWSKETGQHSATYTLQGGQLYYMEALMKEGSGGDNLAVGWAGPSIGTDPVVIEGQYLVPLTPEPTATPGSASCDALVIPNGPSNDRGEQLQIEKNSNRPWAYLYNNSPHKIRVFGASMNFNGGWHAQQLATPGGQTFDYYSGSSFKYDPANPSSQSYSHTWLTPTQQMVINPAGSNYFRWEYKTPYVYGIYPYMGSWPQVGPGTPTPVLATNAPPMSGSNLRSILYHWASDFNASISYYVVPTSGPTIACTQRLTGLPGPSQQALFSANPAGGPFWVRSRVNGDDSNTYYVYFYVYDSTGKLVHWYQDSNGSPYCMFGESGGNCRTRTAMVDKWWFGGSGSPGDLILNGTYTVVMIAEDTDYNRKSQQIVSTLVLQAPTPTGTNTSRPTRTSTSTATISLTPTKTLSPTITDTPTKTLSPTTTLSPTVTRTRTNTPTRTRTNTSMPTATATRCLTPPEAGGCD